MAWWSCVEHLVLQDHTRPATLGHGSRFKHQRCCTRVLLCDKQVPRPAKLSLCMTMADCNLVSLGTSRMHSPHHISPTPWSLDKVEEAKVALIIGLVVIEHLPRASKVSVVSYLGSMLHSCGLGQIPASHRDQAGKTVWLISQPCLGSSIWFKLHQKALPKSFHMSP